jgi:Ferritin-like domain
VPCGGNREREEKSRPLLPRVLARGPGEVAWSGPSAIESGPNSGDVPLGGFAPRHEAPHVSSRAQIIARAVVAGGALTAGGLLVAGFPRFAISAPSAAQDQKILNFALLLEYIEAGFYGEALAEGKLKGELLEYASVAHGHERAHVAFLKSALGENAREKPKLEFGDTTSDPAKFTAAAIALEETMIAAYNGQATNLTKPTLAQAAKIVSVEARHAGWIRAIAGQNPAPAATDQPKTAAQVQADINHTSFVRTG